MDRYRTKFCGGPFMFYILLFKTFRIKKEVIDING